MKLSFWGLIQGVRFAFCMLYCWWCHGEASKVDKLSVLQDATFWVQSSWQPRSTRTVLDSSTSMPSIFSKRTPILTWFDHEQWAWGGFAVTTSFPGVQISQPIFRILRNRLQFSQCKDSFRSDYFVIIILCFGFPICWVLKWCILGFKCSSLFHSVFCLLICSAETVTLNECLQLSYLPSRRNHMLLLYPREILILDLEVNQTVGVVAIERTGVPFLQVLKYINL